MHIRKFLFLVLSWLVLLTLSQASCSNTALDAPPKSETVSVQDVQTGETRWIDLDKLQQGPIQRETLTTEQMDRITALQNVFVKIDGQTVDQWADSFKRDRNPDNELAIWERMAKAYSRYCDKHQLTLDAKKEVYEVVLLRSMASPDEVIARVELTTISKQDARNVMAGY